VKAILFLLLNNIAFFLNMDNVIMGWLGGIASRHTLELKEA
jgi:hypothetical protein